MASDWNEEEDMKRRSFPGALTVASLGVAFDGSLTSFAPAQNKLRQICSLPR